MTPERVLQALANNPKLMWKVALGIRIRGPWVDIHPSSGAMCRWDPWKRSRSTLRSAEDGAHGIVWKVRFEDLEGEPQERIVGGLNTPVAVVVAEADRLLREAGYVLLDEKVD